MPYEFLPSLVDTHQLSVIATLVAIIIIITNSIFAQKNWRVGTIAQVVATCAGTVRRCLAKYPWLQSAIVQFVVSCATPSSSTTTSTSVLIDVGKFVVSRAASILLRRLAK